MDVGERLKRAREARGMLLSEAERVTGIPERHLLVMEQGRFDLLPSPIYVRSYLRTYANAVGENPQALLKLYRPRALPTIEPHAKRLFAVDSDQIASGRSPQRSPSHHQPSPAGSASLPPRPARRRVDNGQGGDYEDSPARSAGGGEGSPPARLPRPAHPHRPVSTSAAIPTPDSSLGGREGLAPPSPEGAVPPQRAAGPPQQRLPQRPSWRSQRPSLQSLRKPQQPPQRPFPSRPSPRPQPPVRPLQPVQPQQSTQPLQPVRPQQPLPQVPPPSASMRGDESSFPQPVVPSSPHEGERVQDPMGDGGARVIYARRIRRQPDLRTGDQDGKETGKKRRKDRKGKTGKKGGLSILTRPSKDKLPDLSRNQDRFEGGDPASSDDDGRSMSRHSRRAPPGGNRGDKKKKSGRFLTVVLWVGLVLLMVFSLAYVVYMLNRPKGKPTIREQEGVAYFIPPSRAWTEEGEGGNEWIT